MIDDWHMIQMLKIEYDKIIRYMLIDYILFFYACLYSFILDWYKMIKVRYLLLRLIFIFIQYLYDLFSYFIYLS